MNTGMINLPLKNNSINKCWYEIVLLFRYLLFLVFLFIYTSNIWLSRNIFSSFIIGSINMSWCVFYAFYICIISSLAVEQYILISLIWCIHLNAFSSPKCSVHRDYCTQAVVRRSTSNHAVVSGTTSKERNVVIRITISR